MITQPAVFGRRFNSRAVAAVARAAEARQPAARNDLQRFAMAFAGGFVFFSILIF